MAEVEAFDETPASPRLVPELVEQPVDPVGDSVGSFIAELLNTATVEVSYHRVGDEPSRALFPSAMMVVAYAYSNVAKSLNFVWFNALNLVGAALLIASLTVHFNLASMMLEIVWSFIALIGLIKALRGRARA